MNKAATLLATIREVIGSQELHVQQITDGVVVALRSNRLRSNVEIDVRHELSAHSGGKRSAMFVRTRQGWYRNRAPGDKKQDPAPARIASGRLTQIVYDAVGNATVNANRALALVAKTGLVNKARCDRPHIAAAMYNNCGKGLRCFTRIQTGVYVAIPGRRPRADPSGRNCRSKP